MTVDDNARMMEKVTRVGDLYDFYGALLTDRQRQMVELHYLDDWSLAEIAEHLEVTRQAVHDSLQRALQQLETFESALHLLDAHRRERVLVQQLVAAYRLAKPHLPHAVAAGLTSPLAELAARYQIEAG